MPTCSAAVSPDILPCDPSSCYDDNDQALRMMCLCIDWQGNPIPGCSPRMPDFPMMVYECRNASTGEVRSVPVSACIQLGEPWQVSPCYCCCYAAHGAAQVATPAGPTALGGLMVGDAVLAAHGATDPGGMPAWHPTTVTFAIAALPLIDGPAPLMINIAFGEDQSLVVHPGQLLLIPGGTLKRADQLVAGSDALVGPEGDALAVHGVTPGYYRGEITYVATGGTRPADWDGSLDGHLLALDGAIVGDYLLELMADSDKLAPHLAASAPVTDAVATVAPGAAPSAAPSATFAALSGPSIVIPDTAIELFSPAQEAAFAAASVPVRAVTDQTNVARTHYFITLFSAFFPQVTVTLDWGSTRANVAAFATGKRPQVVIGGGFARLEPIYAEAIALAIGFGIANRTIRSDATSVGHALYDGVGMILPQALQGGDLATTLSAALDQYQALFALVEPPVGAAATAAQVPTPVPTPLKPGLTLACFAEVIDAAISGVDFPACAS